MFVLVILSPHSVLGKAWGPVPECCEGPQMCVYLSAVWEGGGAGLWNTTALFCNTAG